jgi:asparagine synthase (glutamine-hydrolysing)
VIPFEANLYMSLRDLWRELADTGPSEVLFRSVWEVKMRTGLMERLAAPAPLPRHLAREAWHERIPFTSPSVAGEWLRGHLPESAGQQLFERAEASLRGGVLAFGRLPLEYGSPIEWHRHPVTGRRWPADAHWSRAFRTPGDGDIKFIWEIGRFPHAFWIARAAALDPDRAPRYASALARQIRDFRSASPYGRGVHWSSGLEIAIRVMSWVFAAHVLAPHWDEDVRSEVGTGILESAAHIDEYFDFARRSVSNDHLIGESLALLISSCLFPSHERAGAWRSTALRVLSKEADRQIDGDGAYFMWSHTYQRSVLQYYLWASRFAGRDWNAPLERSLRFLLAHMNPEDGRLPNTGSNDGGLPALLSTCDYTDFRPVLQAVSVTTQGRKVFGGGPWDEEALWLCGAESLQPARQAPRFESAAFHEAGSYVLRGSDPSTFLTFRCGSVANRFPQIDMLHVDVWWKGRNLLVDGGTYLYNGPREWHEFFHRTGSHNTVMIDGGDQMVHQRQFRVIYWTRAAAHRFLDNDRFALVSGQHFGYRRTRDCVHHRSVLLVKDHFIVVYDVVTGPGAHDLRLQWQGGDFPFTASAGRMTLRVSDSSFQTVVKTFDGNDASTSVQLGSTDPIRGWFSRYYGEKIAAPSLVAVTRSHLPAGFVTVMTPVTPDFVIRGREWLVSCGPASARFEIGGTELANIEVSGLP